MTTVPVAGPGFIVLVAGSPRNVSHMGVSLVLMLTDNQAMRGLTSAGTVLRRALAGAIILGLAILVGASYLPASGVAVCRDELANNSSVVRICSPLGTADIVAVGLVLLVALSLLWPDLSELAVPGLVNLKRRVDANDHKAAAIESDVLGLTLAQSAPQGGTPAVRGATPRPDAEISTELSVRRLSGERFSAEREFQDVARRIDTYLRLSQLNPDSPSLDRSLAVQSDAAELFAGHVSLRVAVEALRAWRQTAGEELRRWASVRNIARHFPERLPDEELRDAMELTRRLDDSAQKSVMHFAISVPARPSD